MAFWIKDKRNHEPRPHLEPWPEAKKISISEYENQSELPLGWYLCKDGYRWIALKPNSDQSGFEKESGLHTAREAQQWLGIPVPPALIDEEENRPSFDERLAELKETDQGQKSEPAIPETVSDYIPVKSQRPCNRKRNVAFLVRVTEEESRQLAQLVEESGMDRNTYVRLSALQRQFPQEAAKDTSDLREMNSILHTIRSELGKIGGMLKMIIKPNEERWTLHPEEFQELRKQLHAIEHLKKSIARTLEQINGNLKT